MQPVLEAYAAASPELIDRFNAISSADLFKPVIDLMPLTSVRAVDIGAGTGRDAEWLASAGHTVWAVEPVREFRQASITTLQFGIEWIDDTLPELTNAKRLGGFDLVVLSAVWQHLDDAQRVVAMRSLAELTLPGGLVIISLRHGPGAPERPVYPVVPEDTISQALTEGFTILRCVKAASAQTANRRNGVSWTWLALAKP